MERIVGRKTTRERTGHDPFHGKYDPYEVLDGVYAFSLAGRDPILHGCGGIGRGGVHRAGRGKGHRGYEGVLVLWGSDELQESVALCGGTFRRTFARCGAAVADLLGGDLSSGDGEEVHDGAFPI